MFLLSKRRIAMFRRMFSGMSCLTLCLCSIVLQLPTQVGTSSFFGVFGAETIASMDPECNAIASKWSTCKTLNLKCRSFPYLSGPQSAASGGVNKLRFDPTGTTIPCTLYEPHLPLCPDQPTWSQTPGICTEKMVP